VLIARYPGRIPRTCYEEWIPDLAPSRDLHSRWKVWRETEPDWWAQHYQPAWTMEKERDAAYHAALQGVAALSMRSDVVLACWCAGEAHCHRSLVLRDVLAAEPAVKEAKPEWTTLSLLT